MKAINSLNHGIVEICCMEGHTALLEHFVKLDHHEVPVWKNILKLIGSSSEEEAAASASCLAVLTTPGKTSISYSLNILNKGRLFKVVFLKQ